MAITDYKPYDEGEVEGIRLMLEAEAKEGKPLFFEVKVNANTRILKTNKVERFNELYSFLNENTKELVISIYPDPANNNRKEWYKYNFGNSNESLNGGDMEQKLNDRMKAFEERQAFIRLEEKLKVTQDDLDQAVDYARILEGKIEALTIKPNHFGEFSISKFASETIEGLAVHHPKILEKVPVLNGIAKVIREDQKNSPKNLNGSFEGDVSFKAKEKKEEQTDEVDDHEQMIRDLVEFIGERFDEPQRKILGLVILKLGEKTSQLETIAELLGIDLKAAQEENQEEEQEN